MQTFYLYITKLTVGVIIIYAFYYVALKKLTFYNWNRYYLLISATVCIFLPFLDVTRIVYTSSATIKQVTEVIPIITKVTVNNLSESNSTLTKEPAISRWQIVTYCYVAISLCILCRLFIQLYSLYRLKNKTSVINEELNIHHIDEEIIPFSFGKSIYVNINKHNINALQEIIQHEATHVNQNHYIDIVLSEILCAVNWINPFVWMLRNAIRQNLEFIADNQVVLSGFNKRNYQHHLLEISGISKYKIVNHFNTYSLKNRITMMNKTKSKKISAIRFLLLLPLLCILLLSFRNKLEILPTIKTGFTKAISAFKTSESLRVNKTHIPIKKLLKRYVTLGIVIDDATLQPIAGITVREIKYGLETKTDARGIYKITITDTSSKVDYTFKMSKEGLPYISEQSGSYSNQSDKDETGAIMISSIRTKSIVDLKAGLVNSSSYFSVEPTYENLNNSIALFVKHRENEAALKLANDKNERIFEVKDNQAFILRANGTPYASIDGISPLILIEGKMLTGEELNAIYKRSQFKVKTIRVNDSQSAKKKYNTQYGVFEIELEK